MRYAIPEDAIRAIEELPKKTFEGRNLQIQFAKRRPSQKERRNARVIENGGLVDGPDHAQEDAEVPEVEAKIEGGETSTTAPQEATASPVQEPPAEKHAAGPVARHVGPSAEEVRSIVISNLPATATKSTIAKKARKFGAIQTVTFPVDGRDGVAFVCYSQTKDAVRAVQRLHEQDMLGSQLQVCSKVREGKGVVRKKKARLIIRNLSFKSKEVTRALSRNDVPLLDPFSRPNLHCASLRVNALHLAPCASHFMAEGTPAGRFWLLWHRQRGQGCVRQSR